MQRVRKQILNDLSHEIHTPTSMISSCFKTLAKRVHPAMSPPALFILLAKNLTLPSPPLISSAMQASYEFFSRDFCSHMKRNRQEQKLKHLGAPR